MSYSYWLVKESGQFEAAATEDSLGGWSGYRDYQKAELSNTQLRTSLMEGSRPRFSTLLKISARNGENNSVSTVAFFPGTKDLTAFWMLHVTGLENPLPYRTLV
ncbi:hypothetical protein L915_18297 [Phytophthora nicotianae]|uniref:Uncharacterized protein n=1 Tax=Phytophthora nicotianae TaxID=4792 RepID=W2I4S3_PHYNI|nr:hypothetical protein L915_18297 [Phytophthora nicotianae]ETL28452.1 hypothetical protein L916_18205 [Phytophthora nicotianae]